MVVPLELRSCQTGCACTSSSATSAAMVVPSPKTAGNLEGRIVFGLARVVAATTVTTTSTPKDAFIRNGQGVDH